MLGGFLLLRRAMLDELGGFDEGFRLYGEDIDLAVPRDAGRLGALVCPAGSRPARAQGRDGQALADAAHPLALGRHRALRAQAPGATAVAVSDDIVPKYDAIAERYSAHDYADAERYYARRAQLVARGLDEGASVLDIACGDGGLGRALLALGLDYHGVDASERMVEVARRALGGRVVQGSFEYEPPALVDATTIFRSLYLVPTGARSSSGSRGYTLRKLVFDFDPRAYRTRDVRRRPACGRVGRASSCGRSCCRSAPRSPDRAGRALRARALPGARLITRVRFPLLVSCLALNEKPTCAPSSRDSLEP